MTADGARPPRHGVPRIRRRVAILLSVSVLILLTPAVSFARALVYPGSASAGVRAVGWARDHGAGGLVDALENWWYTRSPPPSVGAPTDHLSAVPPTAVATKQIAQSTHKDRAPKDTLPVVRLLKGAAPGEGSWQPVRRNAAGRPVLWITSLRPDAAHPTVVAAVALMPKDTTALHLGAGTREPVPGLFPISASRVPASAVDPLVAVFNAGWKTKDTNAGWYAGGVSAVPLRNGMASVVIDDTGTATVAAWDASAVPSGQVVPAGVVAVRQNLHLVVEGGKPAAGLGSNANGRWGSSHNQFQFTTRSGVGTDAQGALVYVAGQNLTLSTLAQAMSRAGVVTGMELDMHPDMVDFRSFRSAADAKAKRGTPLLVSMKAPRNRYLVPDQRDFFYVTER
ncbi:MAG: phosphodiester glycosidase family protein [Ornithinibacter sp.]